MVFYNSDPNLNRIATSNNVTPVSRVSRSQAILSGLNEQFMALNVGQQLQAKVLHHHSGETRLLTQFGHLDLVSNHSFKPGEELVLTVTNKQPNLQLSLKTVGSETNKLATDLIVVDAERHRLKWWLAPPADSVLSNTKAGQLLAALMTPMSSQNQTLRGQARLRRKATENDAVASERLIIGYQHKASDDHYTWIDTELGEFKIDGVMPDANDWDLEILAVKPNESQPNFYHFDEKLLQLVANWQLWHESQARGLIKPCIVDRNDTFDLVDQMMLTLFKLNIGGYQQLISSLKLQQDEEDSFVELLNDAKIIDSFHQLNHSHIWLLPILAQDNAWHWLKIWHPLTSNNNAEQNWWQIEWQSTKFGLVQIKIATLCQTPTMENMTPMDVELYIENQLEFDEEMTFRNEIEKIFAGYQLWGDIEFLTKPYPSINERITSASGNKTSSYKV